MNETENIISRAAARRRAIEALDAEREKRDALLHELAEEISSTLPRQTVELIYRASCCKPTPEAAQKESCACVAVRIVEECEEWAQSLLDANAKPTQAHVMKSIFELVDATDDETNYPIGLYLSKDEAVKAATSWSVPSSETDDYSRIEVRERALGFSGWGNSGKTVAIIEWTMDIETEQWHCEMAP